MIFVLLSLMAIATQANNFTYENDVMILDESNFDEALDQFEYIFLDFYAPWCDHCKEMIPHYEQAANDLKGEGILLAKIDSIQNRKLADKQDVHSYPTLKFINQGKTFDYKGPRTTDGIKQFIFNHINPGTVELQSLEEVQDQMNARETLFFYFADQLPKEAKDREFRRYIDFSYTMKNIHFAHTHNKEIREHLNVPQSVNLTAFRKGRMMTYTTPLKIPNMKTFVELAQLDRTFYFSESLDFLELKVFQQDKPGAFLFSNGELQQEDEFISAAEEYPLEDYMLFIIVKQDDAKRQDLKEQLQIRDEDFSGVFIVSKNGTQKFNHSFIQDQYMQCQNNQSFGL